MRTVRPITDSTTARRTKRRAPGGGLCCPGASISNYVWAFRSWLKFQRQLDPIYGVVDWEDFMQGVAVRTWVPAEPRKKVELWWIRDALRRVDRRSFVEVQAAVVMLVLLFTFARSESPLALAFSGENAFNGDKQMQVKDVKVVSGAVLVRLKGIKQDPRMQRPEAAGNEDWIVIGDVPGSDFSIMFWMQLLFSFHRGARQPDAPFFVDRDRTRPYLYSKATADIRALWAKVVGPTEAKTCGLHGLRVTSINTQCDTKFICRGFVTPLGLKRHSQLVVWLGG